MTEKDEAAMLYQEETEVARVSLIIVGRKEEWRDE